MHELVGKQTLPFGYILVAVMHGGERRHSLAPAFREPTHSSSGRQVTVVQLERRRLFATNGRSSGYDENKMERAQVKEGFLKK